MCNYVNIIIDGSYRLKQVDLRKKTNDRLKVHRVIE